MGYIIKHIRTLLHSWKAAIHSLLTSIPLSTKCPRHLPPLLTENLLYYYYFFKFYFIEVYILYSEDPFPEVSL